MEKVLFISAADKEYDGRTRALIDTLRTFADVTDITTTRGESSIQGKSIYINYSGYLTYIQACIKTAKNIGDRPDIVFIDNRKATIPGLLLCKTIRPKMLIYDCRELYIPSEMTSIIGRIGCFFEKKAIQGSDFVICANEDRRIIMKKIFPMQENILVYENIRRLRYSPSNDLNLLEKKYIELLQFPGIKIVSTAGCDLSRLSDQVVLASRCLNFNHRIYLVGCKEGEDKENIKCIAEQYNLPIVFLPMVNQDELKFILSNCDIGVVTYHQRDTNNKYCASGKLYEYIFEGIPVAATDNPPLRRVIDQYEVGCTHSNIANAVQNVYDNLDFYRYNVGIFNMIDREREAQEGFAKDLKKVMEEEYD